ncbi:hypothetical protein [Crassaminicella profunda]|uniref:hypothetical protein n=1 Tax=Crassaminicella profunda TaxID=1286698 RepID=UPI001CA7AE65|nr:hypothetical protein [Crassaminicella profunda]QZY56719.1 hypothetical protein K7H06_07300 [Crassaminicella profunda]
MLMIQNVEFSKNPVNSNEALIIKVDIKEITVTWGELKAATWNNLLSMTWQDVKYKPLAPWGDLLGSTWKEISDKTWGSIKFKK